MFREKEFALLKYPLEYSKHLRKRHLEQKCLCRGGKRKVFNLTLMNKLMKIE